jgi:hypothetical protein
MTSLLIACLLVPAFVQEPDCRSCDLLEHVAGALSEGDAAKFLEYVDKSAPGYGDIAANVDALTAQQDIAASLDVLSEAGDANKTEALVDWFMQFTTKDALEHVTRRRMRVRIVTAKVKGKWKVMEIDPRSILDPVVP